MVRIGAVIAAFIEQRGEDRGRRHVREALAVEKAEQQILLGDRERQRGPRPRTRYDAVDAVMRRRARSRLSASSEIV